ncbi:MAG: sensor domain-containing diguanylate cyclase [Candidatus Hydrogenedentota bacterium]
MSPLFIAVILAFIIYKSGMVKKTPALLKYRDKINTDFTERKNKIIIKERGIDEAIDGLERDIREIEVLYQFIKDVNAVISLKELVEILTKHISRNFIVMEAYLVIFQAEKNIYYDLRESIEIDTAEKKIEEVAIDWIKNKKKSYFKVEEITDSRFESISDLRASIFSAILSPIIFEEKVLGGIEIINCGIRDDKEKVFNVYTKEDVEKLELLTQFIAIALDRINLYIRMEDLSIHDSLTNLYNYRHFIERFEEEIEIFKKNNSFISLILIDIDHFKDFNDRFGHKAGDYVLSELGKILKSSVRNIDFVARYGGEEFAVYLPETDHEGAYTTAERLRNDIENVSLIFDGKRLGITISGGISSMPEDGDNIKKLIEIADNRLYKSKRDGRNRMTGYRNNE